MIKKTLLLSLLTALFLSASDTQLSPFGMWMVCEGANASVVAQTGLCIGFQPGGEQYIILHKDDSPVAVWYEYTITAKLAGVDAPVTVTGAFKRDEKADGYSNHVVNLGGVAESFSISIKGMVYVSETRSFSERKGSR